VARKKSSPEAVRRLDEVVAVPGAERAVMFGCPVCAVNGERYALSTRAASCLRLGGADGAALVAKGGEPWERMKGRRSKGRVLIPGDHRQPALE